MKRIISAVLVSSMTYAISHAGIIVIEGKYQNKNIYVQNCVTSSGVGYCTSEVRINGQTSNDEINSTAFEIDLSQYQLKYGEDVVVQIKFKDGCFPKVLNPEALRPKPTFEIVDMDIDSEGMIKWTTKAENGPLPFVIEQFRWNKWIKIGEVEGRGTPDKHDYMFKTSLHSGENKFRIKQVGFSLNSTRYSPEAKVVSGTPKCEYTLSKSKDSYIFSCETMYEVYDFYGNIVKKGWGKEMDLNSIEKGSYYLCFDNTVAEIKKTK